MKQIENLIVVEVPKGSKDPQLGNVNGVFMFHDTKPIGTATRYQLPFPCSIIGLASEVGWLSSAKLIIASGGTKDFTNSFMVKMQDPAKDYLFLKRKG